MPCRRFFLPAWSPLEMCVSLWPPRAATLRLLQLLIFLSYFISDIYYIYTHTAHTCFYVLFYCYFLVLLLLLSECFFLLFDFGGFFFLNYCATKLLLLLVLLTSFALSLSPSLSLFLPFSLLLSFALLHCALKLVFVCFTADTKTCVRVCSFAFTHTSTLAQGKSRASSCFFSAPCCTHRLLLLVILIQVLLLRVSRNILAPRRGGRPLGTGGRPYSMKLVATCAAQLR